MKPARATLVLFFCHLKAGREAWQALSRVAAGAISHQRARPRCCTCYSPTILGSSYLRQKIRKNSVPTSTADSATQVHTRTRATRKLCTAVELLLLLYHRLCLSRLTPVLEHDLPISPRAPCPGALRKWRRRCCCLPPLKASLLLLRGKSVRARRSRPLGPFPLERNPLPCGSTRLLHPLSIPGSFSGKAAAVVQCLVLQVPGVRVFCGLLVTAIPSFGSLQRKKNTKKKPEKKTEKDQNKAKNYKN